MRLSCILLLSFLVLTGCNVTPHKVPYTPTESPKNLKTFIVISQKGLEAELPSVHVDSTPVAIQFGLAGLIVGSVVQHAIASSENNKNMSTAEKNLEHLSAHLSGYDFNQLYLNEAQKTIQSPNLNLEAFQVVKRLDDIYLQTKTGEEFLCIEVSFKMGSGFRHAVIRSKTSITRRGEKWKDNVTLYQNTFSYFTKMLPVAEASEADIADQLAEIKAEYFALPEKKRKTLIERSNYLKRTEKVKRYLKTRDYFVSKNAKKWLTNSQHDLAQELSLGIAESVKLINKDLNDQNDALYYEKLAQVTPGYQRSHKSTIINQTDNRIILRSANGSVSGQVCSSPKTSVDGQAVRLCN
ncbi:hypothetical protein [Flocculibacter collagenilyticus]|uniref:hypothetical protein n=1 Tax=Flocculibacter collagenilyticus TaxID=2744479 RepID=UPI0018F4245C|nr:hypothetical protein [Flocculibacter collagenilyticus]